MSLDATNQQFWGDLHNDLWTANTATRLASRNIESLISTDGKKAHRPILSHPSMGKYVAHQDITLSKKKSEDQEIVVTDHPYAAAIIDDVESSQTPYDLLSHSSVSIRRGLKNSIEQLYLSNIKDAAHTISNTPIVVDETNILDHMKVAEGTLGAFDAPVMTSERFLVIPPQTVSELRKSKSDRMTGLGDTTLEDGMVGPWHGWTVVQSNNLPWAGDLDLTVNPADGDTVTISGAVFTFKTALTPVVAGTTTGAGEVLIGATPQDTRNNFKACVEADQAVLGTTYNDLSLVNDFMIRRKRDISCTATAVMNFSGFGGISVSQTLTDPGSVWANQVQESVFMVRGSIDLVIQMMKLEFTRKQLGFADMVKGLVGVGAKTFEDGATLMVKMNQDVSGF